MFTKSPNSIFRLLWILVIWCHLIWYHPFWKNKKHQSVHHFLDPSVERGVASHWRPWVSLANRWFLGFDSPPSCDELLKDINRWAIKLITVPTVPEIGWSQKFSYCYSTIIVCFVVQQIGLLWITVADFLRKACRRELTGCLELKCFWPRYTLPICRALLSFFSKRTGYQ